MRTHIAWGIGIGVRNAVWGGCNWWNHDVNINVNRYNNINVNNRIDRTNINSTRWSHSVENRKNVAYRGGDATRQNLERRAQSTNREQYRGLLSTPGKHDGLYWATKPGEPESPLGSQVAKVKPGEGYHGYHYRVLTAQGGRPRWLAR